MNTITNAFANHPNQPGEDELTAALGESRPAWDRLIADLRDEGMTDGQEWKCYSLKYGWSLRLMRKKRNILYLSPFTGGFRVMFIFGDRSMAVVRSRRWPRKLLKVIEDAPKYPEGTGVRIDIHHIRDIAAIKKLAAIKVQP